jgi:hypothetical protein
MLSKKNFFGNIISTFPFLGTRVLEEFCKGRYLLDGIKEWEVDFYLFDSSIARPGDLAEILDESPVESCMAQKRTNLLHYTWGWKIGNQIHLHFVNLNPPIRNDVP